MLGQTLRFAAAIQKVGQGETGVLAVTVFAEMLPPREPDEEDRPLPTPVYGHSSGKCDSVFRDDPDVRWPELRDLLDNPLAAAVSNFAKQLG